MCWLRKQSYGPGPGVPVPVAVDAPLPPARVGHDRAPSLRLLTLNLNPARMKGFSFLRRGAGAQAGTGAGTGTTPLASDPRGTSSPASATTNLQVVLPMPTGQHVPLSSPQVRVPPTWQLELFVCFFKNKVYLLLLVLYSLVMTILARVTVCVLTLSASGFVSS